jgi:hypothetical protein
MSVTTMSTEDRTSTNRISDRPDLEAAASIELRAWHHVVRALPHLVSAEERKTPVRGLVAWYERVVECDDYSAEPPIEGLDALIDELAWVVVPLNVHAELARARWAVRVAEEVVQWRRLQADAGTSTRRCAADRLQRAIEEARNQMQQIGPGSRAARPTLFNSTHSSVN